MQDSKKQNHVSSGKTCFQQNASHMVRSVVYVKFEMSVVTHSKISSVTNRLQSGSISLLELLNPYINNSGEVRQIKDIA